MTVSVPWGVYGPIVIPEAFASAQQAGPADAVAREEETDDVPVELPIVDECAAILEGGTDDISPLQLWDEVMRKYGVAQHCERVIQSLDAKQNPSEKGNISPELILNQQYQHTIAEEQNKTTATYI